MADSGKVTDIRPSEDILFLSNDPGVNDHGVNDPASTVSQALDRIWLLLDGIQALGHAEEVALAAQIKEEVEVIRGGFASP